MERSSCESLQHLKIVTAASGWLTKVHYRNVHFFRTRRLNQRFYRKNEIYFRNQKWERDGNMSLFCRVQLLSIHLLLIVLHMSACIIAFDSVRVFAVVFARRSAAHTTNAFAFWFERKNEMQQISIRTKRKEKHKLTIILCFVVSASAVPRCKAGDTDCLKEVMTRVIEKSGPGESH